MSFICEHCRGNDHDCQPALCPGGTWCDCHHVSVRDIYKKKEESNV